MYKGQSCVGGIHGQSLTCWLPLCFGTYCLLITETQKDRMVCAEKVSKKNDVCEFTHSGPSATSLLKCQEKAICVVRLTQLHWQCERWSLRNTSILVESTCMTINMLHGSFTEEPSYGSHCDSGKFKWILDIASKEGQFCHISSKIRKNNLKNWPLQGIMMICNCREYKIILLNLKVGTRLP